MEIEEMKILWDDMTGALEKQKNLTDSIILKMTKTSYRNKINKILIPEVIGSAVCLAAALFILFFFSQLLEVFGMFGEVFFSIEFT